MNMIRCLDCKGLFLEPLLTDGVCKTCHERKFCPTCGTVFPVPEPEKK
jgi:hypothetical protein